MASPVLPSSSDPFAYFERIWCINLQSADDRWRRMTARFERLGIGDRVERFPAVSTPGNHHVGCALSHRRIMAAARAAGAQRILVFEDDALFLDETRAYLAAAVDEMQDIAWDIFYLGGCVRATECPPIPGCRHLLLPRRQTYTHAVAYNAAFMDRVLAELPADLHDMLRWVDEHTAIDRYFERMLDHKPVIITPVVASQPWLLPYEDPAIQHKFTL
ncbi:MAG: glycosyltransferase family 25 protein [Pseudomonadota bacterium]|nr:glycosyltransferase family 25 protein [Pseudomonadota bacterium]